MNMPVTPLSISSQMCVVMRRYEPNCWSSSTNRMHSCVPRAASAPCCAAAPLVQAAAGKPLLWSPVTCRDLGFPNPAPWTSAGSGAPLALVGSGCEMDDGVSTSSRTGRW